MPPLATLPLNFQQSRSTFPAYGSIISWSKKLGCKVVWGFFMIPNALMYWTGFDLWLIGSTSQEEKPVTTALKFGLICNNVRSRRSNVITGRAIVCCNLPSKHLAHLRFEPLTYVFGRQALNPLQHDRF